MQDRLCLITGATSGIGRETARVLAQRGATVIIVGRNQAKAEATVQQIRQQTGNQSVEYLLADLSSMRQIRDLAEAFRSRHDHLDVLVNNAGAVFMRRQESVDGLEMTFATNHLSSFLLTNLLLDLLKAGAQREPSSRSSRIVNVSSGTHGRARLDFDDLQMKHNYNGWKAYARSKLANLYFTYELARRLEGSGITVNALHPGFVATNLGANNFGFLGRLLKPVANIPAISVEEGARTPIYLASSAEVEGISGQYFINCRPVRSSAISYDVDMARRLWRVSEQLTGLAS